jgi:SSS family solute:Na+ symporter
MEYSKLTLLLVGGFLVLNLVVGLWFGRKATSIRDYALANKSYGVGPLVMTYLATIIGGAWIFIRTKDVFEFGIGAVYCIFGTAISMFITAKYIAPKMVKFRNSLTLGDVIGQLYGKKANVLAGVLSVIFSCIIAGMNMSLLGLVFENFLGLNGILGILTGGVIVTFYSCKGGMKAVTSTDIFQFALLTTALTVMAILAIKEVGSLETLLYEIPDNRFDFWGSKKIYYFLTLILTDVLFFRHLTDPARFDRMLMAKEPHDMSKMLYIGGFATSVIFVIIAIIAFSALVIDPQMNSSSIMLYMINNILPGSLKGFAIISIMAIIFSTADSYMHSAGVSFACSVLKPIRETQKIDTNELQWAKIGTAIAGILSVWFAIWGQHLFRPDYWISFITPIIAAPLLFGIIGIKPEKKAFWISAVAATVTLIICRTAHSIDYPIISGMAVFIATCVSAITYLLVNILINKKLCIINNISSG